ncbi:MAG TPA: GNAT family N-acetyltransferase [bacterium]|nr:GNAT family N-acetyltransferase [bacterium]
MCKPIKICLPVLQQDYEQAHAIIEKTIWRNELPVEFLQNLSSGEVFVAKSAGRVVGVVQMRRPGKIFEEWDESKFTLSKINVEKGHIGHIGLLAVDPEFQGQGIGKKLIRRALKNLKEWGSKCVTVHVWQSSPGGASEKVFRSLGFEPLTLHKKQLYEHSKKLGPENYWCVVCGNPCKCDELEMVKYLK